MQITGRKRGSIEHLYFKRFGKAEPDRVVSIKERAREIERKKEEKRARKRLTLESETEPAPEAESQGD